MSPPHASKKHKLLNRISDKNDFRHKCYNLDDFQKLAKEILPKDLYEYLASGTDDEQTLLMNRSAFQSFYLRPRVMKPVGNISTATSLFGQQVAMPVYCSPAGVHALCEPKEGECATVRAFTNAGLMFGLSQHSTRSIEQVSGAISSPADKNLWFQAYILKDRTTTMKLIHRAIKAGYKGIFITVDSVRFGYREADARNGFNGLPKPHRLVNYDKVGESNLEETYNSQKEAAWDQNTEQMFEQNVSWKDIEVIKKELRKHDIPLVVKGIMVAEDAKCAILAGADGIVVSNHGGRQLDGAQASIDALPDIARQVAGRIPIWLDGGVRRGTDVLKALALGASAVGIGKPLFFALAVGGEDAVAYMLHLLRTELEAAMCICGIDKISDITSHHVARLESSASRMLPHSARSFL